MVGIVLAELFLFGFGATAGFTGLSIHAVTLIVCAVAPLQFEEDTGLFLAFALVPLFRLVNLGLPRLVDPQLVHIVVIYLLLLPALVLVSRVSSIPRPSIGVRMGVLLAPVAVAIGVGLGFVEFVILRPNPLITAPTIPRLLVLALLMVGVIGAVEEWLFRGVLQATITGEIGTIGGLTIASGVFAVMHSGYGSYPELLVAGGIGLVLGALYDRTGSLVVVALAHGTLNVVLFGILPFN